MADLLQRARAGDGMTVFVTGEGGVGKSALIREALDGESGVIEGRAAPPPAAALGPLVDLVYAVIGRGAQVEHGSLRVHRRALRALLPDDGTDPTASEAPTPSRVVDALLALVSTAGPRAPSVIVIEDLHWADGDTIAAVDHLADQAPGRPVAVIVSLRPEGDAIAMARRAVARGRAQLLALAPMAPAEVQELVAARLRSSPPAGLLDAVAVAEGLPLLVGELLTAYQARGELVQTASGWSFSASTVAVPPRVSETVAPRVARLDHKARRVIEAAALLGRDFNASLLPGALGFSAVEVDDALRAGRDEGVLAPAPRAIRLHFAHALVRDAVVELTAGAERSGIAARLLDTVTARAGFDAEQAASLALLAGQEDRAVELLLMAGDGLVERGLPNAAVDRFDRALALRANGVVALRVRESLLLALASGGDAARARAEGAVVARQLLASGASAERLARATVAIARAAANEGRWAETDAALRDLPVRSQHGCSLASLAALELGDFERASALARSVVDAEGVAPAERCEAAEVLGRLARRTDLDEARRWFDIAAGVAELHGLALWRARALHELATIEQLRSLSTDGLLDARSAAVDASAPGLLAAIDFHLAALHGVRFEPVLALDAARRCLDGARRLGALRQEAWAWNLIGQAHAAAGDRIRARAAAAEALAIGPDDPEIAGVAVGTCIGLSSLLADDVEAAINEVADGVARLRTLPGRGPLPPWYLWPLLATVFDIEGDGGARARAETDTLELRLATSVDGLWWLAAAVAAGRAGDQAGAAGALSAADAQFRRVPAFAGYVHLGRRLAAEPALADGWVDPVAWMLDATAWAEARGHHGFARACAALARRGGARERRRRGGTDVPAHLAGLGVTGREVEVLGLVAQGLTNKDIAARLYLSPRTVKGYVEHLLAKTGAANRTQLALFAAPPGPDGSDP